MDAMSANLSEDKSWFLLSRQAAIANKISFCLTNENVLGGTFFVELYGLELSGWIENATWHRGREIIPRRIGDEQAMNSDGTPVQWND